MEKARGILGLPEAATLQEIKTAYKKKALLLHPDRNKSPDAANQFRELHDAYALLSAAPKAALFDVDLADLFREYMPEYQTLVRLLMAHKPKPLAARAARWTELEAEFGRELQTGAHALFEWYGRGGFTP